MIEALIEAELGGGADDPARWWSERARTGRRLEALLIDADERAAAELLRSTFPLRTDLGPNAGPVDRRWSAVVAGDLTDGLAVALDAVARPAGVHPSVAAAVLDANRVGGIIAEWLMWVRRTTTVALPEQPTDLVPAASSPAWDPERLEYAFAVAAPPLPGTVEELVFGSDSYDGTGVEWHTVDLVPGATLGATDSESVGSNGPDTGTVTRHLLPTPVRYLGMPSDRYWEIEDARVNLGAAGAGPTDLARMLAVEYAIVNGPDWFIVPLELPVGSVARIEWIVVRDTFGVATIVGTPETQGADRAGRQFQPGVAPGPDGSPVGELPDIPLLVVLPASLGAVRGESLERVDFQRDEMANLAWGIERRSLGPSGRGRTRTDGAAVPMPEPADPMDAQLLWRLATSVPRPWLPLAPVRVGDDLAGRITFRAADFVDAAENEPRTFGQLLSEIDTVAEEEITRAGLRVELLDQSARAIDGTPIVWRGRERTVGRGEVDSNLRWDATTPIVRNSV